MKTDPDLNPAEIISFWMDAGMEAWFTKNDDFDNEIKDRFGKAVVAADSGAYDHWQSTPEGALALILLLDQFTRNIYRGSPKTWSSDAKALSIAGTAIANGLHDRLPDKQDRWFYMPFMHAEDLDAQKRSVELARATGDEEFVKHAVQHMEIVENFGRFPHRNEVLGRVSTPEEEAYLAGEDAFKG